jgi:hypothetical protein
MALIPAALLGLAVTAMARADLGQDPDDDFTGGGFEISVTNITRNQILSPPVVAVHTRDLEPIFELGEPSSEALWKIAEDALNTDMIASLLASPEVLDVQEIFGAGGPIMPGETASVTVAAGDDFDLLSLVGMLVTTNDGFYGAASERLPAGNARRLHVPAYDAGSEENNELCDFIPGPPCGSAEMRATDGAEGYVHVHEGIHGIGDLEPSGADWRNPVALISIKRVR